MNMATATASRSATFPGTDIKFKERYENYIGGTWVKPVGGEYFDNISPINGKLFTQAARSKKEDVDLAIEAAHKAFGKWSRTAATERSNILNRIAQVIEDNKEYLATIETIDNGKPIRETLNADIPLAVDHFRYFAGCLRSQEGSIGEIDENTMAR